jgi:putative Mg2+ transporter-C (MgtC) family protein
MESLSDPLRNITRSVMATLACTRYNAHRQGAIMDFDIQLLGNYLTRLGMAALAGGILGLERELSGQWAGLRTHMVVSVGAAVFVLLGEHIAGGDPNAGARVVQGVAAGIGFLGAGTILKLSNRERIKGLTTASSIWLAAALGSVAGFGRYELMVAGVLVAIVILALLKPIDDRLGRTHKSNAADKLRENPP